MQETALETRQKLTSAIFSRSGKAQACIQHKGVHTEVSYFSHLLHSQYCTLLLVEPCLRLEEANVKERQGVAKQQRVDIGR